MKKNYFAPILLAALLLSFLDNQTHPAKWLTGTWEYKTARGSLFETWDLVHDSSLQGRSYRVRENDTLPMETIRLVKERDTLFYIPTVPDQNNGEPVRFAATVVKDNELLFTNPAHDFPQWISYRLVRPDSLVASIGGTVQGQQRQQVFPMKKIR
jgi:hypothetical protein